MIGKIMPSRITEAREVRALSMGELADRVAVTRQSISKYERGIVNPSLEVLMQISNILDFPIDYFYKADATETARSSSLFFRSNSNIAKKVKTACRHQIKWSDEIKKHLSTFVDFISQDIPTIDTEFEELSLEDVEELALNMRNQWGLGSDPIIDLVGILENKGIIISQFAPSDYCSFTGIDGFSSWRDGTPYILYHATQKSAVRTRFSIAHELGHLVMHNSVSDEDSIKREVIDMADMQADRFAAAFLLPATSFPNDIRNSSLTALEHVKKKWGASMSTIIRRCETLEILSESQINYLKRQMTIKKYWHKEPLDEQLHIDGPEVLRDATLLLIDSGIITRDAFINLCALSLSDIKSICSLPDDFFIKDTTRQKPALRILETINS